jgi:hypothetical protein
MKIITTDGRIIDMTGQGEGYVHTQNSPASTWTVSHSLGYRPEVQILRLFEAPESPIGYRIIGAQVTHLDENELQVDFNSNIAGLAVCV